MLRKYGEKMADGRWFTASAERNKGPILDALTGVLPENGMVLEIGSGTGQHVIHFATATPHLIWQPSDSDPEFRRSVSIRAAEADLTNIEEPTLLDVCDPPWSDAAFDAVVCINMIHVAPWAATQMLFDGARLSLAHGGVVFLYGPYRRYGHHTATSNETFDAELRAHDEQWGLRDIQDVEDAAAKAGFAMTDVIEMPANNFSLVFR